MKYSLLLFVFYVSHAAEHHIPKMLTPAYALLKQYVPKKYHAKLAPQLNKIDKSNSKSFAKTVKFIDRSSDLASYRSMLMLSAALFFNVPGYQKTLHCITDYHDPILIKGHAYELQRAISLFEEGDTIVSFNSVLSDGIISREIDIRTDRHMVECKNIKWRKNKSNKLKKQFSEQRLLVDDFNESYDCDIIYQVSSKQPIPQYWKVWLVQNGINIHEETLQDSIVH